MKLVRYIAGYSKQLEILTEVIYLEDFSLESVAPYFDVDGDPQMYLCYAITGDLEPIFKNLFGVELDLSTFDYFLECGTTDNAALPGHVINEPSEATGYPPPLEPPTLTEGAVAVKPKTSG